MKLTVFGLIFVGIIAAVSAVMVTGILRNDGTGGGPEEDVEIEIYVAAHAMPSMSKIDGDALAKQTVLTSQAPIGSVQSTVQVIGQILTVPMQEGQPFLTQNFAADDQGMHIAGLLPQGGRAMSIVLSDDDGIESVLYPGCVVDVMASFRLPGMTGGVSGEVISATLLQAVSVLSIGNRSVVGREGETDESVTKIEGKRRRIVTLLVDPHQAEALQLASNHGNISLALRNPLDEEMLSGAGVALSELSDELAQRLAVLTQPNLGDTAMEIGRRGTAQGLEDMLATGTEATTATVGPTGATGPATTTTPEAALETAVAAGPGPDESLWWSIEVLRGRNVERLTFPIDTASDR